MVEALEIAVVRRQPAPGSSIMQARLEYVSLVVGQRCASRVRRLMGARGSALDNAVCESFFASLKKELIAGAHDRRAARRWTTFKWLEGWCSRPRLHSTLG